MRGESQRGDLVAPMPKSALEPHVILPHEFAPRSYQREPFIERDARKLTRFISVWHRKAGKDLTWWNFLIREAAQRVGMHWFMLPTIEQGKKVVWKGFSKDEQRDAEGNVTSPGMRFLDHIPRALLAKKPNDSDHLIELRNGSMIQVLGSDKLEAIVGPNPIGVVFDEYSVQFPAAWEQVVSPILEQNGGWAAFAFTPRGRNHAFKLYENALANPHRWSVSVKTIDDTLRDSPGERGGPVVSREQIDQLRAEGQDEDLIQQEYYCSFYGSYVGAYYARILAELRKRGQVREIPHDPSLPVFTVWDLGIGDQNSIWFAQAIGRELRLIDYLEGSGQGLPYYTSAVRNKPYTYSNHWAPHDIEVREYSTGESRKAAAAKLGINFRVVPKLTLDDGIDAVRRILPRCYFDRINCDTGLRCLENYAREQKPNGEFASFPKHDKWSHGADAFRYLALISDMESSAHLAPPRVESEFDIFGGH